MIEAKELRIGNLVNYIYSQLDFSIISGLTYEVPHIDEITGFEPLYDELEPIPITEEWLLKFGVKNGYLGPIRRVYGLVNGSENDFELCFEIGRLDFRTIKYVHQLQNLYFALTGQELTLCK